MDPAILAERLRAIADELVAPDSRSAFSDPLRALERAAVAEEVASVVRHDLRNNLGSIRNAAFYLKRRSDGTELWKADPRVPEFFGLIDDAVVASIRTLEERLSLKHLFAKRVARTPARECIELAVTSLAAAAPRIAVDAGPGEIEADPSEIALAIRCLVENALEATAAGTVSVALRQVGADLAVEVSDDGGGVAPEHHDRLFEAFFTTKAGHAGLGLNIASRVARRYGGRVALQAQAASGTCFVLALPSVTKEQISAPEGEK